MERSIETNKKHCSMINQSVEQKDVNIKTLQVKRIKMPTSRNNSISRSQYLNLHHTKRKNIIH
jgi:hypothetical protein